jgi:hypothetical protein
MGVSLSWRMPASTQYLTGYLAELENASLYEVFLNGSLAELENTGLYAVPEWVSR